MNLWERYKNLIRANAELFTAGEWALSNVTWLLPDRFAGAVPADGTRCHSENLLKCRLGWAIAHAAVISSLATNVRVVTPPVGGDTGLLLK